MANNADNVERILEKLDELKSLLQDMLILEGVKAGIPRQDLRKMVGVDMNRITHISKAFDRVKKN
jgi:hypothetical protein